MDITTILAVVTSGLVFLAWFVLPGKAEAKTILPAELPDAALPQEVAA
jgi:hypothetical protein